MDQSPEAEVGKELEERNAAAGYTVLFDGSCPICRKAVERLRKWDKEGKLRFLSADSPELDSLFPWISDEALQDSLHLVGSGRQTWEGAGAVEELMRILPGWKWAARLFGFPGARWMARRVYLWIAENRFELSCVDHCGSGDESIEG